MSEEKKSFLVTLEQSLTATLVQKAASLPKNFNQTKFTQNCLTVLESLAAEKKIEFDKIEPITIVQTLMKGAVLGLDFLTKECYPICYKNKDTEIYDVSFQTDYKGEKKLVKLYSVKPVSEINTELVREGDFFEKKYIDNKKFINFQPKPFNDCAILGAFTIVVFEDGSTYSDDMSKKEMDDVKKNYSKAKNSPAWEKSEGEMYRKTVIRRTTKGVEKVFESPEQLRAYEESSEFEFNNGPTQNAVKVSNVFAPAETAQIAVKSETIIEGEVITPEEKFYCSDCSAEITEAENGYSKKHFKRPLCRICQKAEKGGSK